MMPAKGYKQTKEARRKISEANKGRVFTNSHKKKLSMSRRKWSISEETKRKLSISLKGRIFSKSHRRKLSKALKGRIVPKELRERISLALKGKKHGPHTIETRQKMSLGHGKDGNIERLTYKERVRKDRPWKCERCSKSQKENGRELTIHHKDRNRNNNKLKNLEIQCDKCHMFEHIHSRRR